MVVALTERELRQDKIGWTLTKLMNFQTIKPKWGFMSLSVHEPHDFVSFLYLSFFFFILFSHMSSLVWEGKKECERKNWSFFSKIKIDFTRLDYYVLFFCACCSS